jgi:hypothetical protein
MLSAVFCADDIFIAADIVTNTTRNTMNAIAIQIRGASQPTASTGRLKTKPRTRTTLVMFPRKSNVDRKHGSSLFV